MDTNNVCSNYSTNLYSTAEDICDQISPSLCQDSVCTSSYGCSEGSQVNCSSSANMRRSAPCKSKECSLKSMKSMLKKVDPCKRANLLEDVKNYLGGNSCSYEDRISFDEDSDDIIVRRKRNVETKRIRGDKLSSDIFAKMLSSSTRSSNCSPKRSRDKKISSQKNGPVRESSQSLYFCQGQSSSKIKEKEKMKLSYTPRLSHEAKKSEMKSKPTPVSKSKTTALSFSTDSTSTIKYSKDPKIECICRQICAMAPTCRPIPKEEMCLKPYMKRYSRYASKIDTPKTDSKDRKCTSGTYTTKVESKSSTFKKRSPSPSRSKKCIGDGVTKNKKGIGENERECKSKCSRSAFPLPSVKQEKEKKPLKTKSVVLNKREGTILTKQKAVSGDNIKMKIDKVEADNKSEVEKCIKKKLFDDKEEHYDVCALGPKPVDSTNNNECGNVCTNETIALVQDFCERMKTATERQAECSSVIELKQKMTPICVEDTAKDEVDLKTATLKERSLSPLRSKKCIGDGDLKYKKEIDENSGQACKSKCSNWTAFPLPAKQEKRKNPLKTKSEIFKTKGEATVLAKKNTVCGANIKMKIEKEEADNKRQIKKCAKREPLDDTEEYYDACAPGLQSICINAESGNVCDETSALVQDFCARIKTAFEKQADCSAVVELRPKVDQICINGATKDELDVAGRTFTAFSPKAASTFIERTDNNCPVKEASARRVSFPPTFKVCGCMKQRRDRLQSILTDGKVTTLPKDIGYYRQSIISKRSNDRLEQSIVEHGGDGGNFDVSLLPPPPIYDKSKLSKNSA